MITHAKQLIEGVRLLSNNDFDIILLDINLPDSEGLASFSKLLQNTKNVPVIILSAVQDEFLALRAIQKGAQDYIVKRKINQYLIKRSIRYTIERYSLYSKLNFQANLLVDIPDAIISTHVDFTIQSWNTGAEEIYGWKAQEVLGKKAETFLKPNFVDLSGEEVKSKLLERGVWRGDVIQRKKDSTFIDIFCTLSIIKDEAGERISILVINRDNNEIKKAQRALQSSEVRYRVNLFQIGPFLGRYCHYYKSFNSRFLITNQ